MDLRRGGDVEGDMIGVAVIAAVLLLMPLPIEHADWLPGITGLLVGLVLGWPLARFAKFR
jgi:hypothetical protein